MVKQHTDDKLKDPKYSARINNVEKITKKKRNSNLKPFNDTSAHFQVAGGENPAEAMERLLTIWSLNWTWRKP